MDLQIVLGCITFTPHAWDLTQAICQVREFPWLIKEPNRSRGFSVDATVYLLAMAGF